MANARNTPSGTYGDKDKKHVGEGALADHDSNPDLITGSPGSHPGGTAIGSASGAATGAAIGAIGGPPGAIIGGIVGAITGAAIGHGVGEYVDPTEEAAYWRKEHGNRDYYRKGTPYEEYEPAYAYGYAAYRTHPDKDFDSMDQDMADDWKKRRGTSQLEWDQARPAARDAWSRVRERSHGK